MKTQTCLTRFWQGALLVAVWSALAACTTSGVTVTLAPTEISATPTASPLAAEPQPASATPTLPAPSPTPTVSPLPPEALAVELQATVIASLPPTSTPTTSGYLEPAFEGARVLTLTNTIDDRPLWAA